MNYKTETNSVTATDYNDWCDRCASCWQYSRQIYMGLGAYMNTRSNTVVQLKYAANDGLKGGVIYSYGQPYAPGYDSGDWWSYAATNIYTNTATAPVMPWRNPATATNGMMWGRLKDAKSGSYLDNAKVTVGSLPSVNTDGNGYYVATLIPAAAGGTAYSVTASNTGMTSLTISNATVLPGDIVRYDFTFNIPKLTAFLTKTNTILVSWPSPYPGWNLLQLTNFPSTNWISPGRDGHQQRHQ